MTLSCRDAENCMHISTELAGEKADLERSGGNHHRLSGISERDMRYVCTYTVVEL